MKRLLGTGAATIAVLLLAFAPAAASFNQCVLNCPAGDGGVVGPGDGNKSPDLNQDALVSLPDLAIFAAAFPPGPYDWCVDFNCDGVINIVDVGLFATHWLHTGPFPGFCQPAGDHYKTYVTTSGIQIPGPIVLADQFDVITVSSMFLSKVATPVKKNRGAYCDSLAHQTWWEFLQPEPDRIIRAKDQFGEAEWFLGASRFLLTPALKNQPPDIPLPKWNHYKCYEAQGPTYGFDVMLEDQFGIEFPIVLYGKLFCNPTKKILPDGTSYDIVDPRSHLTCYQLDNPIPHDYQVFIRDQFIESPVILLNNDCLCLPAQKTAVIQPTSSEWERIRALFKDWD